MDVTTPIFTAPVHGTTLARVDVRWREAMDGAPTRFDSYATRAGGIVPIGASFDDAVRAAISLSRGRDVDPAVAILQSTDGVYHLARLAAVVRSPLGFDAEVDTRIDGRIDEKFGSRKPNIAAAHVTRVHPDVRAVVGAYSWVDLRTASAGDRQSFPKLGG